MFSGSINASANTASSNRLRCRSNWSQRGNLHTTARIVEIGRKGIVAVREQNIAQHNILVFLRGVAVHASQQEVIPPSDQGLISGQALGLDMFDSQLNRDKALAVAAIATQPADQIGKGIAIVGEVPKAGRSTTPNRPHQPPPRRATLCNSKRAWKAGLSAKGEIASTNWSLKTSDLSAGERVVSSSNWRY